MNAPTRLLLTLGLLGLLATSFPEATMAETTSNPAASETSAPTEEAIRFSEELMKDKDVQAFMKTLQDKIRIHWHPPRSGSSLTFVTRFLLSPDGQVSGLRVTGTSGNSRADSAGLKAIRAAAPFSDLPSILKHHPVNIEFTFDYRELQEKESLPHNAQPLSPKGVTEASSSSKPANRTPGITEGHPQYGTYVKGLRSKMAGNWMPPYLYEDMRAQAQFTLGRDGQVSDIEVTQPASYEPFNNAVKYAIKESAPYSTLPKGYPDETMRVELTFETKRRLKP